MTGRSAARNTTTPKPTSCVRGTAMSTASRPDSIRATAAFDCARRISRSGRARSMSEPERDRKNDLSGCIDEAAPKLRPASRTLVQHNEAYHEPDEADAQTLTAAVRLYVATPAAD